MTLNAGMRVSIILTKDVSSLQSALKYCLDFMRAMADTYIQR